MLKPGIKTTEFWLAFLYLALVAFWPAFNEVLAAIPVVSYQISRAVAKVFPTLPPPPPPPPPSLGASPLSEEG